MSKLIIILIVGLVMEAIGVVFLNKGLKQVGTPEQITVTEVVSVIKRGVTNPNLLTGVFFEALFFGTLLMLMSKGDVSFIWPLTSLGFVLTTLAARFVLHEQVTVTRWAGVCLIMAGAAVITWTEQEKEKLHPAPSGSVNISSSEKHSP